MKKKLLKVLIKTLFLSVFLLVLGLLSVYPQFINSLEEQTQIYGEQQPNLNRVEIINNRNLLQDTPNHFLSGNTLLFFGAGYGTEGFLNFEEFTKNYTLKTLNVIPPLSLGLEFSITDFFSIGSEINYFSFKPEDVANRSDTPDFNLYLLKMRSIFHYNFSRINLYLGGTLGVYMIDFSGEISGNLFKPSGLGSLFFSGVFGIRVFFFDTLFFYTETAYPFPLVMGGIGFKF